MLLWLCACTGPDAPDDTAPVDTDADADTDTDADTDSDTDTDTDTPGDLGEGLSIATHPDVVTVLVASWQQNVASEGWLTWELDGEAYTSPVRSFEAGPATMPVFGLPAEQAVDVTLHLRVDGFEQTDVASGATGLLPEPELATLVVTLDTPERSETPWLLTSVNTGPNNFFGPCYVVILDRAGRVVWYRAVSDNRLTLFPRVARDGTHILWDATTYYVTGVDASITAANLSLTYASEVFVPALGFTWDEDLDGSWIFDEAESGYDYHLSRYKGGLVDRIWSCRPWMQSYSSEYWACAANTALAGGDWLVYSMFETSTVVGIDPATGEIAWELGDYPGGLTILPDGVGLELQHYPNWTPDGTLLLTTHVDGIREQHIREFALDIDAGTATQVWDYTPTAGYYGDYAGEATRLANGNTLINFGTDGVVQEVTPARDVVWELDWANHLLGHLTPVADLYALDGE